MDFTDAELERYSRQIILREIGGFGQMRLKGARVLVIGAGGLGAPVLTLLSGAGVGFIRFADDDHVERSNLPRQPLYTDADVGRGKVDAATDGLRRANPNTQLEGHPLRADPATIDSLMAGMDLVIDGSDNFATRLLVNDAAVKAGITLISGAVAGFEGQIATFAPHLDNTLPCYRCFIPQHPGEQADRTCADMGIMGPVTALTGAGMAFEAIREIVGMTGGLKGKLQLRDLISGTERTIRLPREPLCPTCGHRPRPEPAA